MTIVIAFNDYGRPGWLKNWKKLDDKITVMGDSHPNRILYARNFLAGKITLGGNRESNWPKGNSMYTVFLVPIGTIKGLNDDVHDWTIYQ